MEAIATLTLPADSNTSNFTKGSIFFIGTATVIIRYAGFTILTDPNFLHRGDRVHLGYGLQSARLTDPAMEIEELPPLDLVILSHMHEDHFDRVAAAKLDKNLPIITTQHAAEKLQQKGFTSPQALETWESLTIVKGDARLRITAMPGIHGPSLLNSLLPPVMGSLLEFQTDSGITQFRLYITGDTLIHQHLYEIPQRYPDIDLALLHLGGTKVFGVLLTMDAKQGVEAVQIISPNTAIPIHYDDYTVFKSALEDFKQAIAAAGLENRVQYLDRGDTYPFTVNPSAGGAGIG